MELLSTADAAERLNVSERQVRRLLEAGKLSARRVGGRWLVDSEDVRRRSRSEPRSGRPLSPHMAWAVLAAVESALDVDAEGPSHPAGPAVDRRVRHRVQRLLAGAPPLQQWSQWLRHKATIQQVWVHPGVVDRLAEDGRVHPANGSVVAAQGLGIVASDRRCFYLDAHVVDEVLDDYRGQRSDEGQVALMIVPPDAAPATLGEPGSPVNTAATLVDLLVSPDARESHFAAEALEQARQAFVAGRAHGGSLS